MKANEFLNLMGEIDDSLIVNAKNAPVSHRSPAWRRMLIIAAAACLVVSVLTAMIVITMREGPDVPPIDTETTESAASSTENSPSSEKETEGETSGAPPWSIGFDSMEQISVFLQAANGSAEEWDQYLAQNLYQMSNINHTEAKEVADRISGHVYPFIKEGFEMEGFGADIVPSYEEDLDVRFKVNGSTTRFIYYYDRSDLWNVDGELFIEDVPIYNTTIDLYYGERWANGTRLYGLVVIDGVMVNVVIFLEDGSEFSLDHFDCFEFRQIGS